MTDAEKIAKAKQIIFENAGHDGAHHKDHCIDQVLRALTGCPIVKKESVDYKGNPYTYEAFGESEEYLEWVRNYEDGEDGPNTYEWIVGIPA